MKLADALVISHMYENGQITVKVGINGYSSSSKLHM